MNGIQSLKNHLEVMLELTTKEIERAPKQRLKDGADEWDKGYSYGKEDAYKTERVHLEMLLSLVKNELEKAPENPNPALQNRAGA